jgi:cation/acetate symporter
MIADGWGQALVSLLLKDTGVTHQTAVIGIGILMIVYVVFGGMLATTWVQDNQGDSVAGRDGTAELLVLKHFGFSLVQF